MLGVLQETAQCINIWKLDIKTNMIMMVIMIMMCNTTIHPSYSKKTFYNIYNMYIKHVYIHFLVISFESDIFRSISHFTLYMHINEVS